jgi:hypothetical protein
MSWQRDFNPHSPETESWPKLSPDDQRLVDALMEVGFDRRAVESPSPADGKRLDAICGLMGLMREYPVEDASDTLLHATLARIDRHEHEQAERMKFDVAQERRGRMFFRGRIRVPDFITVAAVILIGVSVLWPVLNSVKQRSLDLACANNMKYLGYAFGQYANDNNHHMPLAMAGAAVAWDTRKNTLNLGPLIEGGYCKHNDLTCPGHRHNDPLEAGPSYSYRLFRAGAPIGWGTTRVTVVLGDLNPIVGAARRGAYLPPLSGSLNHAGRGQNVLVSDGATMWLEQPIVGRNDNIWLPNGRIQLLPGDGPVDDLDVLLTD